MSCLIIIGSLLFAFRNTNITLQNKQVLTGILKDKPTEHHFSTSRKFYDDIRFSLSGFELLFTIENFEYKASYHEKLLANLNKGDTVTIWVDKFQLNKKTENILRVYQLQNQGISYVNINERNAIKSRYSKYSLIVTLYGLILIFYKTKTGNPPSLKWILTVLAILIIGIYRITV